MAKYRNIKKGDTLLLSNLIGDVVRVLITDKYIIEGTKVVRYDYLDSYEIFGAKRGMSISKNGNFPKLATL